MDSFETELPRPGRLVPSITIAILTLALVAGGGIYAYQKSQSDITKKDLQSQIDSLKNQVTESKKVFATSTPIDVSSPSPVAIATTTTDTTSVLKTYSNTSLGFSLKYPSTMNAYFTSDTRTLSVDDATKSKPNSIFLISVAPTTKTLDQFLAEHKSNAEIADERKITLDGKAAYEGQDNGIISQYGIYSVVNGKEYILRFNTNNGNGTDALKAALSSSQKQIISSFTFTP